MRILLCVISLLYLCCSPALAQHKLPTTIFHKHIQTCHFIGTTEEYFVINFYQDSTVEVVKYSSSYRDSHNSIFKIIYTGTFVEKGDSIFIEYSLKTDKVNYNSRVSSHQTLRASDIVNYPPDLFIVSDNFIFPGTGGFPRLERSTIGMISAIEGRFQKNGLSKPNWKPDWKQFIRNNSEPGID